MTSFHIFSVFKSAGRLLFTSPQFSPVCCLFVMCSLILYPLLSLSLLSLDLPPFLSISVRVLQSFILIRSFDFRSQSPAANSIRSLLLLLLQFHSSPHFNRSIQTGSSLPLHPYKKHPTKCRFPRFGDKSKTWPTTSRTHKSKSEKPQG